MKKGELLQITEGEYDDYSVYGIYGINVDFDMSVVLEEYLVLHPEQREDYRFESNFFLKYIIDGGYITLLKSNSLHLGNYSTVDSLWYDKDE